MIKWLRDFAVMTMPPRQSNTGHARLWSLNGRDRRPSGRSGPKRVDCGWHRYRIGAPPSLAASLALAWATQRGLATLAVVLSADPTPMSGLLFWGGRWSTAAPSRIAAGPDRFARDPRWPAPAQHRARLCRIAAGRVDSAPILFNRTQQLSHRPWNPFSNQQPCSGGVAQPARSRWRPAGDSRRAQARKVHLPLLQSPVRSSCPRRTWRIERHPHLRLLVVDHNLSQKRRFHCLIGGSTHPTHRLVGRAAWPARHT